MQPTSIEWVKSPDGTQGYSANPIKGICPRDCKDNQGKSYCYARRLYDRFGWDKTIRIDIEELLAIERHKKPAGIFLGSTFELFWGGLERFWQDSIFRTIRNCPQHRFYLLTKEPQNLVKFSPFSENCFVGVSATNQQHSDKALQYLLNINAKIKFISYEPLLEPIHFWGGAFLNGKPYINWVIIGQCTPVKQSTQPKIEWVREIIEAADKAEIPVFLKYNLVGLLPVEEPYYKNDGSGWAIRQEFPNVD